MVAPTCIIRGLGVSIGLDVADVAGATGGYDSNYEAKFAAGLELLLRDETEWKHTTKVISEGEQPLGPPAYDFCFLHIKGIDDAGHDRKLPMKM